MFSISNYQKLKIPAKLDIPSTHKFLKGANWAGMSLSDAQLPFVNNTTGTAPSAAEITYMVNKGFNSVRLLIKQEVLQGNNSTASGLNKPYTDFAATPFGLFKTAVDSMTSQGIYVILARHQGIDAQFGQAFGSNISGAGGSNPASVLSDFWRRMAEAFGVDNPMIGYSIDNEPLLGGGPGGWWDIAQECINSLRRAGSGQCIFVPGISYSGGSQWNSVPFTDPSPTGGVSNATKFLSLVDPCDNIIAELHCYFSAEDSGAVETNVASTTIGRTRLANVVAWANTNNKRFIIGEFGSKAGITNSNANIIDYVQYCKDNSTFLNAGKGCVGMQWWTFGSYAFWNGYAYTLATQGSNPPTGTDSAQMTLLGTANYFADPTIPVAPPAFNPATDVPGMYARWRAEDWNPGTGFIPDSSGLAADTTKDLEFITTGTNAGQTPDYSAADAAFNNVATIGCNSVAGGRTISFRNRGNVDFSTPLTGAVTVYGIYYITAPPSPSTCYLRSSRVVGTTAGGPSLYHFSNYQATRDGTNNVGGSAVTGMRIICTVYNGASSTSYVNSTSVTASGNAGTTSITSIGLGNPNGQASLWRMAETYVYNGAHSGGNVTSMMNFLGAKYALSGFVVAPVIDPINTVPIEGGDVVITGRNFVSGITGTSDGVSRTVTFVNPNKVIMTVPSHAAGAVNVTLTNPGTSLTNATLTYYNPAALPLTTWLDATDFVDAVHPAQPTWNSRTSAGTSTNRKLYRRAISTMNPIASTIGTTPVVFFNGTGGASTSNFTTNSMSYMVNNATPTTPLTMAAMANTSVGMSFSIVVSHPYGPYSGATSSAPNYLNPQIIGGIYGSNGGAGGYNPFLCATSGGYQLAAAGDDPLDYYQGTRPQILVLANTLVVLQGKVEMINLYDAKISLRIGKGAWISKVVDNATQNIFSTPGDFSIAGFYYPGFYAEAATPKISELIMADSIISDTAFDQLAERAAVKWNVSVVDTTFSITNAETVDIAGGIATINGTGFINGDVVRTDGTVRTTTFVSANKLTCIVPSHAAGTVTAQVVRTSGFGSATVNLKYLDISALNLPGYWKAQDYNAGSTPKLPGTTTAGGSGARPMDTSGKLPTTVGAAIVDGIQSIKFGGTTTATADNSRLGTTSNASVFGMTVSQWHIGTLVKVSATQIAAGSGAFADPAIANSGLAALGITAAQYNGRLKAGATQYNNTTTGFNQDVSNTDKVIQPDTWVWVEAREFGGVVQTNINRRGWSAGLSTAATSSVANPITIGNFPGGSALTTNHDWLTMVAGGSFSDADMLDFYQRLKSLFPSAGLP